MCYQVTTDASQTENHFEETWDLLKSLVGISRVDYIVKTTVLKYTVLKSIIFIKQAFKNIPFLFNYI